MHGGWGVGRDELDRELWLWSFKTSFLFSPNLHAWELLTPFFFFFLAYLKEHGNLDL